MLIVKRKVVALPSWSSDYCEATTSVAGCFSGASKVKKGLSLTLRILLTFVYIDLYLENENC